MQILLSLPGGAEWFLIMLVGVGLIFFWIKMIIEIASSEFQDSTTKIVWLLVTVLLGIFGALIYYFAGRNARLEKTI